MDTLHAQAPFQHGATLPQQADRAVNAPRRSLEGRKVRISSECPDAFGLWLTTWEAMHFIPCPTIGATHSWLSGHGVKRRGNGTISRFDLDKAVAKKSRRGVHLHQRKAS